MKKNVASQVVGAQLNSKTDGTAVTSGTTTVYVTGDGGTQATGSVGSGACTHEGQGFWTYAPAQAETNYNHVAFTFANTNAVGATVQIYTSFPQTVDNATDITSIKAKTDNLPSDPADASVVAGLIAGVETKVDTVDTVVDAIKVKTDFLPSATAGAAGGVFIAGTNAATTITTSLTTTFTGNLSGSVGSVTGAVGSVTGAVGSVTGAVGSVTGNVGGNVTGSVGSVVGAVGSVTGAVGSVTAAVTVGTNNDKTGYALTTAGNASVADKILGRNLAGSADGTRTVADALRALRNKTEIGSGTLTVYAEDDTTPAWTAAVTTAAGDPLTSIDPA